MKRSPLLLLVLAACPLERSNPLDPAVHGGRLSDLAPVMTSIAPRPVTPGQVLVVAVTAADAEQDSVTIQVSDLPAGATFDGAVLRFAPTPDQSGQTFTVPVLAADDTGQESSTFIELRVDPVCADYDLDGFDGYHPDACPTGPDCNDADRSINPDAPEIVCDGIDNDCRPGTPDDPFPTDQDNDTVTVGCGDCDDTNPVVYPGTAEVTCDGLDNDCDPSTLDGPDSDGDYFSMCVDCDDTRSETHPLAVELCDGLDNDCDGDPNDEICP